LPWVALVGFGQRESVILRHATMHQRLVVVANTHGIALAGADLPPQ